MIQEPTDSTFRKRAATSAERDIKAKNQLLFVRNLTSQDFSKYQLSINLPFPHFASDKLPMTKDNEFGEILKFPQSHNAALRCEQRYHKTKPYHRKHETNDEMKNAKRCESLLNALLCVLFREHLFIGFILQC